MNENRVKSWLVCIDDTDDIGTKGTGEIAQEIAKILSMGEGESSSLITRHQLYVHPDIPYTSHNSAMCFRLESNKSLEQIKQLAVTHLIDQSAPASDPGLAILDLASDYDRQKLIQFGLKSKCTVKTKEEAYILAAELGVDLSEHGGTGLGIIGALAGIGLRLYGQDGRVKGQFKLGPNNDAVTVLSVEQILMRTGLDCVISVEGEILASEEILHLKDKIKAVYCQHKFSLLVYKNDDKWCNALKQQLKVY